MKLWAGRFQKETNLAVNDFNSSIMFDARLYKEDITGSIAHATMLGSQGIIEPQEARDIVAGLRSILEEIEGGEIEFSLDNEDIHMNVESLLTEKIGPAGKRLHTGRSRNDQVALDMRMYLKTEIGEIKDLALKLLSAMCAKAELHLDTVMPGYTHMQRAQPTTFAHYMMAYANMLKRDVTRLNDCYARMDEMPLGAGALASTSHKLNRQEVCDTLGFARLTDNSLDAVSDRDFVIELCSAISILMMHLSRISEEIILWCSWEFGFVELDDAFSTGSSIMPQKKNPDVCELIRGKTGRVYGDLITILTVMKALPLAYNKDMQEDKEAAFDAIDTVKVCLEVFIPMFETMTLKGKNMKKAASKGFINATDCADYLTRKGMPFRDAYMIVGNLVNMCIKTEQTLETLTLKDFKAVSGVFEDDIYHMLELKTCVSERNNIGGPAPSEVSRQIAVIKSFVKKQGGVQNA